MTTDLRISLGNKWLYLTCLVVFLVLLRACAEPLMPSSDGQIQTDYITLTAYPSVFSGLMPFAVLFCVIPYACSFFDEMKSGFTRYALLHTTRRRYILSKILAVTVSGALALAIPYALLNATGYALCRQLAASEVPQFYANTFWEGVLLQMGGEWMLLLQVFLAGIYGAVWSLSGLFCSCLFQTRLAAIVIPFIGYQTIWTLFMDSKYCPLLYLSADYSILPSLRFVLCMQALYLAIFLALSYFGMKWRCKYA